MLVVDESARQVEVDLPGIEGVSLNRIQVGAREYFFTKSGHYDGWGESLNRYPWPWEDFQWSHLITFPLFVGGVVLIPIALAAGLWQIALLIERWLR